jgi:hypothetical protein
MIKISALPVRLDRMDSPLLDRVSLTFKRCLDAGILGIVIADLIPGISEPNPFGFLPKISLGQI